ncbi:hypothetical protein CFter6_3141 [Collimonas fungivorans]|uniref:Uncharacterized protein n=1 Tax=Collimonas fungivorans TaxID=158899 RepID=A0A127PEE1_9BURK|nr:hypothetical protein CFter6_3141 [Collimonas fungivorans]
MGGSGGELCTAKKLSEKSWNSVERPYKGLLQAFVAAH